MSDGSTTGRRPWADMFKPKDAPASPPPLPKGAEAFLPPAPAPAAQRAASAAPAPEVLPAAPMEEPESGYQAFVFDRAQRGSANFVEVRYYTPLMNTLEGYLLPLTHLVQVYFAGDNMVVLRFTESVFTIEGRGVRRLVDLLHQRNLHIIQEWNVAHWPEPPADQPKVTKVSMMTMEEMLKQAKLQRGR